MKMTDDVRETANVTSRVRTMHWIIMEYVFGQQKLQENRLSKAARDNVGLGARDNFHVS